MNLDEKLESIVARITDSFREDIDFIVLFGSAATGHLHGLSDLDIGVMVSTDESVYGQIKMDLLSLFDPSEQPRTDVTLLNNASLSLLFRVIRNGKVLFARNQQVWDSFVEYVLSRYPDNLFLTCVSELHL